MTHTAPKFKKIVLILKEEGWEENSSTFPSTIRVEHEDCGMMITGNYVVITEDHRSNVIDQPPSVMGKVYQLNNVDSYKLFND